MSPNTVIDFQTFCSYRNRKALANKKADPIDVAIAELGQAITDINVRWATRFMTIWGFAPLPPRSKRNDDNR